MVNMGNIENVKRIYIPKNLVENPLISVIVPVYNVSEYLEDCIYSLKNQSISPIELIFVNDSSTDDSLEILIKEFQDAGNNNNLVVIDLEYNMRQGGARNIALKYARGRYIAFLDSDDFIEENCLKKLYSKALSDGSDVVYGKATCVAESASVRNIIKDNSFQNTYSETLMLLSEKSLNEHGRRSYLVDGCYLPFWSGLWRKEVLEEANYPFPEKVRYEDDIWHVIHKMYVKKYSLCEDAIFYYRQRENSTVHEKNAMHHFDLIKVGDSFYDAFVSKGFMDEYKDEWQYIYVVKYVWALFMYVILNFDEPPVTDLQVIRDRYKKYCKGFIIGRYVNKIGLKSALELVIMGLPITLVVKLAKLLTRIGIIG